LLILTPPVDFCIHTDQIKTSASGQTRRKYTIASSVALSYDLGRLLSYKPLLSAVQMLFYFHNKKNYI